MLHVFLDSSILRQYHPSSELLNLIRSSCQAGQIRLHVPELVVKEIATGLADEARATGKALTHFVGAVDWLTDSNKKKELKAALQAVTTFHSRAEQDLETGIREWLEDCEAIVEPLTACDTHRVFTAYFAGTGAFRSRKHRADIPDGFIFDTLTRLRATGELTCAVIADQRLRAAAEGIEGTVVFERLADLIQSEQFRSASVVSTSIDADAKWLKEATDYCRTLQSTIEFDIIGVIKEPLLSHGVHGDAYAADENATISNIEGLKVLSIDWVTASRRGDSNLLVEVNLHAKDATVDLFISQSDYWGMDEEEESKYDIMDLEWNDHYVWALATRDLEVSAIIEIDLVKAEPFEVKRVRCLDIVSVEVENGGH